MTTGIKKFWQTSSTIQQALADAAADVAMRSVTKKYGAFTALENLTLDIPAGSYCCLLGPSGCGKTTALWMIAGHEEITSGDILIGDLYHVLLPIHKHSTFCKNYQKLTLTSQLILERSPVVMKMLLL